MVEVHVQETIDLDARSFKEWLEANPNRKLLCNHEQKCAIAQYVAETQPFPEQATHVSLGITRLHFFRYLNLAIRPVKSMWLPVWAQRFINEFDDAGSDVLTPEEMEEMELGEGGDEESSWRYLTGAESKTVLCEVVPEVCVEEVAI